MHTMIQSASEKQASPAVPLFPFHELESVALDPTQTERLGLASSVLRLRRVWPRRPDRFGLEYADASGALVPGQWFRDTKKLTRAVDGMAQACVDSPTAKVISLPARGIALQGGGADLALPALASLLAQPGARLVVHRPERRAVVRLAADDGVCYAKVVRPDRVQPLAAAMRDIRRLARGRFETPEVLAVDPDQGELRLSRLEGVSLNDLLAHASAPQAARRAGRALAAMHALTPPAHAVVHGPDREAAVLLRWLDRLQRFAPQAHASIRTLAAPLLDALANGTPSQPVLLHRDFYDKQVFVRADGAVGLLDFDTLSVGEAALDMANGLVHFELRALQGRCTWSQAAAAAWSLLDGYAPGEVIRRRLRLYANATRLRLACVYSFRPLGRSHVPALLARLGQPVIGAP